jgi:hypothetical protein
MDKMDWSLRRCHMPTEAMCKNHEQAVRLAAGEDIII